MKIHRFVVLLLAAAVAGWAGAWTALRQIPPERRRPAPLIPAGERHRLPSEAVGGVNPRALRDWHFAAENNIALPKMIESGQIVKIGADVEVEILRSDLDLVLVKSMHDYREYWMRAIDVDPRAVVPKDRAQN